MSYREFAYYYDQLMEDMPYPQWIDFALQCWERVGKPVTVVDLGCGTGNLSIPLARMGFHVTGIDISSDMLSVARQKLELSYDKWAGPKINKVTLLQQDIREWELPQQVDAVISFCDCLNYLLEEEELLQAFKQVHKGLAEEGSFIFDVHTGFQLQQYAEEQPFTWNEEDLAYIWNCSHDDIRNEIEHDLTIFAAHTKKDDQHNTYFRRIDEIHKQRAYPLDWITKALGGAGFSRIECFADFTMDGPTEQTKRAFFVAMK